MNNYMPIKDEDKSLEELMKEAEVASNNSNLLENQGKNNKLVLKIVAGVVGLVLISGGVVLGARLWDPLWNPFRPSPEKVLSKMINNDSAKKLHIDSNIDLIRKGNETGGISIVFSEDLEANDEENIKSKGSFDMVIESEGIQFLIGLEVLSDGADSFFRINKIPTIPGLGLDFGSLKNQWIKNDSKTSSFDKGILKNVSANNLVIKKQLADEKINNQKAYHYVVGFKEEGIDQLINKIYDSVNDELSSSTIGEVIDTSELEDSKSQLKEVLMGLEVEIWVGKKDYSLYKIKINEKEFDNDWFVAFDMEFSELTEPLVIEIPSEYSTIEDIMMILIFGGFSDVEDDSLFYDRMRETVNDLVPVFNLR